MEIWGATDQSMVRKQNQDTFRFLELGGDQFLAVVCDGMGGAKSGDVASRLAAEVFEEDVRQSAVPDMEQPEIVKMLVGAVKSANRAVYEQSLLSPDFKGMGTTLVAVFLQGSAAYIINVGDSRCYYLSEGEVSQVTEDHSVVGLMVARGQISEEEARNHPNKNQMCFLSHVSYFLSNILHKKHNQKDSATTSLKYLLKTPFPDLA